MADVVALSDLDAAPWERGWWWSDQQTAMFDWFRCGIGNLIARARAGTGKTTTIIAGVGLAPERRILLAAFNKPIAIELQSRVPRSSIEAKTLHGLGFGYIRANTRVRLGENGERARELTEAVEPHAPKQIARLIRELHTRVREVDPMIAMDGCAEDLAPYAARFDLLPDEEWDARGWHAMRVCDAAFRAMKLAREPADVIDFADMIFLPIVHGWVTPKYDLVVVDEAQDMTLAQLTIAVHAGRGRVCVVGDDRQCHPPGVMVDVGDGEMLIERLSNGSKVRGWNRNAQKMVGGREISITERPYEGQILDVAVGQRTVPVTPNHRFICRWTDRARMTCVTYLMWRSDLGFRVGWCQLFANAGRAKSLHLAHRARIEKAERTWILAAHNNRTDASIYESIIAAQYGIPTATFEPVHGATHLVRGSIDRIFASVADVITERGIKTLNDHGRVFEQPLYPWPGMTTKTQGRRTYFEVHASNLMPLEMSVPLPDASNVWRKIDSITSRPYRGPVYSLDVEEDHSYSANGIVVLNSIYSFRGADAGALDRLKHVLNARELGLTVTRRCPKRVVEIARELVPDFEAADDAPEGEVVSIPGMKLLGEVQVGDFILSRKNAPLVRICMELLKRKVRARIRGNEVGKQVAALIERIGALDVENLRIETSAWARKECERARRRLPEDAADERVAVVRDQEALVLALTEDAETLPEVNERCASLFSDDATPAVMLSSVHKAKGLEADNVFILRDTFRMNHSIEESNLIYVAITRAKKRLVWVEGVG